MFPNTDFIPFAQPSLDEREEEAALRVLRSGWLTTGRETLAFEKEFAAFLEGEKSAASPLRALAVNSATSGLHLALEALGVGPGDLVATPVHTFTACPEMICALGAHPLFIDVEESTGGISPPQLEKALAQAGKGEVKAVVPVHLGGRLCSLEAVFDIAGKYQAAVVEDAAHALPCPTPHGAAGTLGDAGVFSFYATKTITTGEGGMVVTRREDLARRMETTRFHGINKQVWKRYGRSSQAHSWRYDVTLPGYKYNMGDLAAALGRVQLSKARDFHAQRKALAQRYREGLSGIPWLELPPEAPGHAWHLYPVLVPPRDRDLLIEALYANNIGTSVHFIPFHRMTYWRDRYKLSSKDFPVSEGLFQRSISLPLWPGLPEEGQEKIMETIRRYIPAKGGRT